MPGKNIFVLYFLFYLTVILLSLTLSFEEFILAGALIAATAIPLGLLRPLFAFSVIVADIICLGFFLSGMGFIHSWNMMLQIQAIKKFAVYIAATGTTWLITIESKKMLQRMQLDNQLILQLKKYEKEVAVLTLNEFLYQAQIIYIAMQRRGESGYFVRLTINPGEKRFALKTLFEYFSLTALRSTRNKYDLVGKISDSELLILLQNTHKEGTRAVTERFLRNLEQQINVPSDIYNIDIKVLPDTWQDAYRLITNPVGE